MKQHVVSQVLLRRWTDAKGLLVAHDLRYDATKLKTPGGEGYIAGFISQDPIETEKRWQRYENPMPTVFEAIDRGDLFDHPDLVAALKDFLALHFARSRTIREVFTRSRGESDSLENILAMANDADFLKGYFRDRYGLDPAGPEALLLARDGILEMVRDRFGDGGSVFEERVEEHFVKFQKFAQGEWYLHLGIAQGAEFLIGDDPVQVVDHKRGVIGVLSGVSLSDADTLLMPLGPRHVVAIATDFDTVELSASAVARVNRIQVLAAQAKVYYRREADLTSSVSNLVASEASRAKRTDRNGEP